MELSGIIYTIPRIIYIAVAIAVIIAGIVGSDRKDLKKNIMELEESINDMHILVSALRGVIFMKI